MMFKNRWINFKQQFLFLPLIFFGKAFMRLNLKTCRITVDGLEHLRATAENERCIIMLWHNRWAIMPEILATFAPQFVYCAFISSSRDGDLLAHLAESYRNGRTLRVPRGARHQALGNMIAQLKKGGEVVVMTPDGPRGPRYEIKPGIVMAAKETSAGVLPMTWSASQFWQLKSWDKLILPKPFSKIHVSVGTPIYLTNDNNKPMNADVNLLQNVLLSLDSQTCSTITSELHRWPK